MQTHPPVSTPDKPNSVFPKTLIVDLSKGYGGSTSRVLSLMLNSPHDRIALAGLASGAVVKRAQELGLCTYILGNSKLDLRMLPRLIQLIRDGGFEVLDTQNIQAKFWTSLAALWQRFAFISTIHSWYASSEQDKTSLRGKFYTALELLTNHGLDLYISVSKKDFQELRKAGFAENKIQLIYNAVSINPKTIAGDPHWLQQKFGLASDSIVCTAVGRLVPVKGYDILIEAMKRLAADIPNLVVLIVGEGEQKDDLQHQIEQSGLQGRVQLVGYYDRDAVLSIVKSSDIFAMPSRYEGTPIALLEAAALGCPIVSTLAGGIPELVTDGEHALLVPPNDPQALSEGLAKLAGERGYAQLLGINAQNRIQQYFNLDKQVEDTWNAYRKAWNRHRDLT